MTSIKNIQHNKTVYKYKGLTFKNMPTMMKQRTKYLEKIYGFPNCKMYHLSLLHRHFSFDIIDRSHF
jgi:hypothetical protein